MSHNGTPAGHRGPTLMALIDLPVAVLRLQYRVARAPLSLLSIGVFARMATDAPVRLSFERAFGSLDATVGSLLRDSNLEVRGIDRIEWAAAREEPLRLVRNGERAQQRTADQLRCKRALAVRQTLPDRKGRR